MKIKWLMKICNERNNLNVKIMANSEMKNGGNVNNNEMAMKININTMKAYQWKLFLVLEYG